MDLLVRRVAGGELWLGWRIQETSDAALVSGLQKGVKQAREEGFVVRGRGFEFGKQDGLRNSKGVE